MTAITRAWPTDSSVQTRSIVETKAWCNGTNAWVVSGHAYGTGSGELTAIAYCARMGKPKLTEVASSPAPIGRQRVLAVQGIQPKNTHYVGRHARKVLTVS